MKEETNKSDGKMKLIMYGKCLCVLILGKGEVGHFLRLHAILNVSLGLGALVSPLS